MSQGSRSLTSRKSFSRIQLVRSARDRTACRGRSPQDLLAVTSTLRDAIAGPRRPARISSPGQRRSAWGFAYYLLGQYTTEPSKPCRTRDGGAAGRTILLLASRTLPRIVLRITPESSSVTKQQPRWRATTPDDCALGRLPMSLRYAEVHRSMGQWGSLDELFPARSSRRRSTSTSGPPTVAVAWRQSVRSHRVVRAGRRMRTAKSLRRIPVSVWRVESDRRGNDDTEALDLYRRAARSNSSLHTSAPC